MFFSSLGLSFPFRVRQTVSRLCTMGLRIHFVVDPQGWFCMGLIIFVWLFNTFFVPKVILFPHYEEGHISPVAILCKLCLKVHNFLYFMQVLFGSILAVRHMKRAFPFIWIPSAAQPKSLLSWEPFRATWCVRGYSRRETVWVEKLDRCKGCAIKFLLFPSSYCSLPTLRRGFWGGDQVAVAEG